MRRKTTLTKTWINSDGTRIPLPVMKDDYIKNAYRRCVEITLGNHVIKIDGGSTCIPIFLPPFTKPIITIPPNGNANNAVKNNNLNTSFCDC